VRLPGHYNICDKIVIDIITVSAGFDAAAGDVLGGCFVSPACYAQMTHLLMTLSNGKIAVCLEVGEYPFPIAVCQSNLDSGWIQLQVYLEVGSRCDQDPHGRTSRPLVGQLPHRLSSPRGPPSEEHPVPVLESSVPQDAQPANIRRAASR
jgi:hypothetical protein